jgi:hypothetical protein
MTKLALRFAGIEVEYQGRTKFLERKLLPLIDMLASRRATHDAAMPYVDRGGQSDQRTLDNYYEGVSHVHEELDDKLNEFLSTSTGLIERMVSHADDQAEISRVVTELQRMHDVFKAHYLQVQGPIQREGRGVLSNIMKTKHDTAKNSISNIR